MLGKGEYRELRAARDTEPGGAGLVGADPLASGDRRALIADVGEDVAHVAVLAGANLQGEHAGRFKPYLSIALGQRQRARQAR